MTSPLPFPVETTYRVRANARPLSRAAHPNGGAEGGLFDGDADWPAYVTAKLDALENAPARVRASAFSDTDRAALGATLRALCERAASALPDRLRLVEDTLRLPHLGVAVDAAFDRMRARPVGPAPGTPLGDRARAHLARVSPESCLVDAVALALQEDYAILRGGPPDAAELLHVCFPSGWSAADKIGQDFSTIHGPVPDNAPLRRAHRGLVRAMIEREPLVRYVWGLHRDDALCHDPTVHRQPAEPTAPSPDEAVAASWFRVERQTTLGVPAHDRAVFLIRVYRAPLATVIDAPERAQAMAAALRDMTPEIAAYKGVVERREPLIAWLDARARGR